MSDIPKPFYPPSEAFYEEMLKLQDEINQHHKARLDSLQVRSKCEDCERPVFNKRCLYCIKDKQEPETKVPTNNKKNTYNL